MTDNSGIVEEVIRKNKLPSPPNTTRYTSGIMHNVYDLGDYVLKIEGDAEYAKGSIGHQRGILDKLVSIGAKVPKVLDSAIIENKPYLLMEKLSGSLIANDWMKFDMKQKEKFIAELAEELGKYHSLKSPQYSLPICSDTHFQNLDAALRRIVDFDEVKMDLLSEEHRSNVDLLRKFYEENIDSLNEENTAIFIHNDIHLENIFYEGEHIT